MRSVRPLLQFFGWGNLTFSAFMLLGALFGFTSRNTARAASLPKATKCTQCTCNSTNKTCRSQYYSGCSTLCTICSPGTFYGGTCYSK
jgi:hypothetical protein